MSAISSLTVYAVVSGSLILGFCLAWFAFPQAIKRWLAVFPRNIWAGRVLVAVDIALIVLLLLSEGFSWIDAHRPLVFIAAPAAFLIIVIFMDEFLSARALGGLFLLIPFWILKAAFIHPAASRLLMTSFAYLLVAVGMVLVWSPYLFRKFVKRAEIGAHIGYAIGLLWSSLGLAMIILGLIAY
ncbi:MAG: hypothetical protein Q7J98_05895 [Kiritimatiellia bacterium]|nr:hypothetical protein [Kiritimatiellia bacterium]